MPFLNEITAGTFFRVVVAFLLGAITTTYFTSGTDVSVYQPNVVRVVYEPWNTTIISHTVAPTSTYSPASPLITTDCHTTHSIFPHSTLEPSVPATDKVSQTTLHPESGDLLLYVGSSEAELETAPMAEKIGIFSGNLGFWTGIAIGIVIAGIIVTVWMCGGHQERPKSVGVPVQAVTEDTRAAEESRATIAALTNTHLNTVRVLRRRIRDLEATAQNLTTQNESLAAAKSVTDAVNQQLLERSKRLSHENTNIQQSTQKELQDYRDFDRTAKEAQRRLVTSHKRIVTEVETTQAELSKLDTQVKGAMLSLHTDLIKCKSDLEEALETNITLLSSLETGQRGHEARVGRMKTLVLDLQCDNWSLRMDKNSLGPQVIKKDAVIQNLRNDLRDIREALDVALLDYNSLQSDAWKKKQEVDAVLIDKRSLQSDVANKQRVIETLQTELKDKTEALSVAFIERHDLESEASKLRSSQNTPARRFTVTGGEIAAIDLVPLVDIDSADNVDPNPNPNPGSQSNVTAKIGAGSRGLMQSKIGVKPVTQNPPK